MTREALRDLLDMAGSKLAYVPNTEPIREELAKLVLDRYQELGRTIPDRSAAYGWRWPRSIASSAGSDESPASLRMLRVVQSVDRSPGKALRRRSRSTRVPAMAGSSPHRSGRALSHEWRDQPRRARLPDSDPPRGQAARRADLASLSPRSARSALIDLSEILVLKDQLERGSQGRRSGRRSLESARRPSGKPSDLTSCRSLALVDGADRTGRLHRWKPASQPPQAQDLDLAEAVASRIVERGQEATTRNFRWPASAIGAGNCLGSRRRVSTRRINNMNGLSASLKNSRNPQCHAPLPRRNGSDSDRSSDRPCPAGSGSSRRCPDAIARRRGPSSRS